MDYKIFKNDKINEKVYIKKIKSGLNICFVPKKDYIKKYCIFATKFGSNDNEFVSFDDNNLIKVPEGVAHFLEHKLFEQPEQNIFDSFSRLGSFVNAYTSFDYTSYLFSCTDNFYDNLKLLTSFVQSPYFTDENVEKEKGIIAQEIKMYEDDSNWRVFFNCLKGMYFFHPVRIDIAGTIDSIKKIDKNILYKCYNTFYRPENMVLFAIGDVDFDKIIKIIETVEEKKSDKLNANINRIYPDEPEKINQRLIEEKFMTSSPIFAIGFKDYFLGLEGREQIKKEITTNILLDVLFGNSSLFYDKLYNEGLIYGNLNTQYAGSKYYGHSIVAGESKNPKLAVEKLIDYINRLRNKRLSKDDYIRIKKKYKGNYIMSMNSIQYIANNFVNCYFNDFLFIDYLDIIESIRFEDIYERFYYHFRNDNYSLSIIEPL